MKKLKSRSIIDGIDFNNRVTQEERDGHPDFKIYHSKTDTGLWFSTDIVGVCRKFLAAHPSETIITNIHR